MSGIVISGEALAAFVAKLFAARGLSEADALVVAEGLVWADLRGVGSHGVSRVERYMKMIDAGDIDPKAKVSFEPKGPSLVVLRAARAMGPIAMKAMVGEAERRAKETGCCIGIVAETTHTGAIGQYAERLARRGLASIILGAGPPMMAYHGASIPSLSTSPLAIGVPRGKDSSANPLVLDMATAVAALGRIKQSKDGVEQLPEGTALDAEGRPTTDPQKASTALPLGGAKGSGLSLMFECLTSLMVGVPILVNRIAPSDDGRHRQNALMIAIDVAAICEPGDYAIEVERLAKVVKALPLREGFEEALLPGERGSRVAEKRRREGIPVSSGTWSSLAKLAAALGVPMP